MIPSDLPDVASDVVRIELHRVSVPLVAPRVAAHGTETTRESIIVGALDADGVAGWGECVALARPTYTPEWTDGAWNLLTDVVVPAAVAGRASGVVGHPMATGAVADAVVDLGLRRSGQALSQVLGSGDRVRSCAVIGIEADPEGTERVAAACLEAGHRAVKLKISPGSVATVARIREAWPDLDLSVDANGSFHLDDDRAELAHLDALGLSYLEQPLPAEDLVASAALRRRASTPIALDESIVSLGALEAAVALGAVDLVNVKPGRLGGLRAVVEVLHALVELGVEGFVGGMYELGIARASALAVAASPTMVSRPTDLGPTSAYVERDLTEPFSLDPEGCLRVATSPGIGRVPDLEVLAELRVAFAEFER